MLAAVLATTRAPALEEKMSNIVSSKGYSSSYRGSNAPGAYYEVLTSDFGEPAPAQPTLTLEGGTGTLASSTAFVEITWITAEGVSLPSAVKGISVSAANDGVLIALPSVPTNGAPIIGWQVYTQASSGVKLNTAGIVPAPTTFVTTAGTVTGIPIATTSVFLNTYGTGAVAPTIDQSGIQPALPSIAANSVADYYFIVPNGGSLWKNYKSVGVMRPDSTLETAGISASYPFDCVSPLYPGATPGSSTYGQVSVAPNTYMVMNGLLFVSTQTGSQNTAATFVGAAAFNVAKGTTVTDGSVTWLCLGKATLVHVRFENTLATGGSITPVAQEYDLFVL